MLLGRQGAGKGTQSTRLAGHFGVIHVSTGDMFRTQAAQGTARVADNIADVNRGATETGSASAQVLSSARSLSKESNQLKTEVEKFLGTVRAA